MQTALRIRSIRRMKTARAQEIQVVSKRILIMDDEIKRLLRARYPDDALSSQIVDYLAQYGSSLWALVYGELFWPTFVEIDGMVFWSGTMRSSNEVQRAHDASEDTSRDRSRPRRCKRRGAGSSDGDPLRIVEGPPRIILS